MEKEKFLDDVKTKKDFKNETEEKFLKDLENSVENLTLRTDIHKNIENAAKTKSHLSSSKKCRYFNRGFCKYATKCKYAHPADTTCNVFLTDEQCFVYKCPYRHTKDCRYWKRGQGCHRGKTCQYLHKDDKRFRHDEVVLEEGILVELTQNKNNCKENEIEIDRYKMSNEDIFSGDKCADNLVYESELRTLNSTQLPTE